MTEFERAALERLDISHATYTVQCTVSGAADSVAIAAAEWARPSAVYRPTVSLDGNMYCALYGEDLMAGVAGFGDTMEAAMRDFDKNWHGQKAPTPHKAA